MAVNLENENSELRQRIRELEAERDIFARTLDKRDVENQRLRGAIKRIQKIVPWNRPLLMIEQDEVSRSLQEALEGQ